MRLLTFVKGIGLGAALMYFYDPERGRRRRALARDQAIRTGTRLNRTAHSVSRDLSNRARGLVAEVRSFFTVETPTDIRIVERVRARIGHVVSHPAKVKVSARFGVVTLGGAVLASEVPALLQCVTNTRGVVGVRNEMLSSLVPNADPDNLGEVVLMTRRNAPLHWSPGTRIVVGMAGGALTLLGRKQGGMVGSALSALGVGMVTRSFTNKAPVGYARPAGSPTSATILEASLPEPDLLAR